MPQRPEDYQSTLNVGGNKKGGTDARTNDPFSYVKVKPEHAYLGHFRQEKFLEDGHNVMTPRGARRSAFLAEHPVIAAKRAGTGAVREAKTALRQAKAGTAAFNPAGTASVASLRAAVAGAKTARSTAMQTAKLTDPNSRYNERIARAARVKGRRGGGTYMA